MNKVSRSRRRSGQSTRRVVRPGNGTEQSADRLTNVLKRMTKAQLVAVLADVIQRWPDVGHHLMIKVDTQQPARELVDDIRASLNKATYVPKHEINHNFSFDYGAYKRVGKGLKKLIDRGLLSEAMELALEVMRQGSYQVEMSDEGLMSDEVVDCVRVVYDALQGETIDVDTRAKWLKQLAASDSVGFLVEAVKRSGKHSSR